MNRTAFCAFFKRCKGMTFAQLLTRCRLDTACELLKHTQKRVSEMTLRRRLQRSAPFRTGIHARRGDLSVQIRTTIPMTGPIAPIRRLASDTPRRSDLPVRTECTIFALDFHSSTGPIHVAHIGIRLGGAAPDSTTRRRKGPYGQRRAARTVAQHPCFRRSCSSRRSSRRPSRQGWLDGTPLAVGPGSLHDHALVFLKSAIVLTSWIFGYIGIKHLPLTIVGPINATRPVLVLVGAFLLFGERLNAFQWTGVALAPRIAAALEPVGTPRRGRLRPQPLDRLHRAGRAGRRRERSLRQVHHDAPRRRLRAKAGSTSTNCC